ncbi:MAG: peptidase MA family metallohydrolase [Candidatus Omnitrophica bacterium]|nr:peptidase MA family metallohydrolase [Candidatus Omnitrophota bacterium]
MKKNIFLSLILFVFCISSLARAQDEWRQEKDTHVIVYYKNAPYDFIKQLRDKTEVYYNEIADNLGFRRYDFWLWEDRAKIYIYDNKEDYVSSTGQPEWSGGVSQPAAKTIKSFPYAQGFLELTLPHEMGHIIFREFVGMDNRGVPIWLDEGVASYQQKIKFSQSGIFIKNAIAEGSFMGLKDLAGFQPRLWQVDADLKVKLFYMESFNIVDFLMTRFGRDNFVIFCQDLRDKKDLEKALSSAYPFSNLQELEEAWKKHINNG